MVAVVDALPGVATVVIGDPDAWQSKWSLFSRMRVAAPIVFDGCGTSEFRSLSGLRTIPPPLAARPDRVWLLAPEGEPSRASWPEV